MEEDGKNCIFYFSYVYLDAGSDVTKRVDAVKGKIKEDPQYIALKAKTSIFWVLKIDWRNPNQKKIKERNLIEFELKSDLDQACKKEIDMAIIASVKDKRTSFQGNPDNALKMYVSILEDKLQQCKIRKFDGQIANIAKRKADDQNEQRVYKQETDLNTKLNDQYVDCAEFLNEVLSEAYDVDIKWDCDTQFSWFKSNGITGSDFKDAQSGDVLYWTRRPGENDLAHTGIVYSKEADGKANIVHSTCRGDCSGNSGKKSIINDQTNNNGHMWFGTSFTRYFRYWARIMKE